MIAVIEQLDGSATRHVHSDKNALVFAWIFLDYNRKIF
jgi:hypothetical protein